MLIPNKAFANTKFNDDVLITEYFPVSKQTQHGVVIPCYPNGEVSNMFKSLFSNFPQLERNIITPNKCSEPILSKEEYKKELESLLEHMRQAHGGNIRFEIKDIDEMYSTYISVNSSKYLAGVMNICKLSVVNPVHDTVITPPEGVMQVIGFETYISAVRRNVPELELDMFTANTLYSKYLKTMKSDGSNAINIGALIKCPSLQALVGLIGSAGNYINKQTIDKVVIENSGDDTILNTYYDRIQSKLGVRERIARSLLLYHPVIVNQTIAGARKHLGSSYDGTASDRPVVYYKSRAVEETFENSNINLI